MNPRPAALALVCACSPPGADAASTDTTAHATSTTAVTGDDTGASTTDNPGASTTDHPGASTTDDTGASTTDDTGTLTTDDTGTSTTDDTDTLAPPDGYWLPLACGTLATVGQGNDTTYSHNGLAKYAFDIVLDLDTPVHAMAEGTVLHIYADNQPGDPCHDGGDESCFPYANLVVLLHGDGTTSLYKHLNRVLVEPDAYVPRGGLIGLSGSTGWSNLPHLHVMRMEDCGATQCQSLPLEFVDAGVPVTGEPVSAAPCP